MKSKQSTNHGLLHDSPNWDGFFTLSNKGTAFADNKYAKGEVNTKSKGVKTLSKVKTYPSTRQK